MLMKWFRKNNTKILAFVVIVLMIAFVGGTALRSLLSGRGPGRELVATYNGGTRITNEDLNNAMREVEVLRSIGGDRFLRSMSVPLLGTHDLRGLLLGELIFPSSQISPYIAGAIREVVQNNRLGISEKQINEIYQIERPGYVYWYLLTKEAEKAGMYVPAERAKEQLGAVIPQIFEGATYATVVRQSGASERQVLQTFGKLMGVLEYSRMMVNNQSLTDSQIRNMAVIENETLSAEMIRVNASELADADSELNEDELVSHFNRYKDNYRGSVSDENPYGFGYKLGDMVQLEYIAFDLGETAKIIDQPDVEELERYYQSHYDRFVEEIPADPDDPDSVPEQRQKRFVEVRDQIRNIIVNSRRESIAQRILERGRELGQADAFLIGTEEKADIRELVGDYDEIAARLSEEFGIDVYVGKTGHLGVLDVMRDRKLGSMIVPGNGAMNPQRLSQVVFAIEEIGSAQLGPFDIKVPQMFESVGPFYSRAANIGAVIRVVDIKESQVPDDIDLTISKKSIVLGEEPTEPEVYAVREQVEKDLRGLHNFSKAEQVAKEVLELSKDKDWAEALAEINEKYYADKDQLTIEDVDQIRRVSSSAMDRMYRQSQGNPAGWYFVNQSEIERRLVENMYDLIPSESNEIEGVKLEFKPELSWYVFKTLNVDRLDREQYSRVKAFQVFQAEMIASQSQAAVHFNPSNIEERLEFTFVEDDTYSEADFDEGEMGA